VPKYFKLTDEQPHHPEQIWQEGITIDINEGENGKRE
jgi:hypothetical protein